MKTFRKPLISFLSAAVGGKTGTKIGNTMDQQASEIVKKIPDAKVERVGEGINIEFSCKALFGFDTSSLVQEANTKLDKLIAILISYADTDIAVQGYTNNKGTKADNMSLSRNCVGSVSAYLTSKGIAGSRVKTEGFGQSAPKYDIFTKDGRSQNRRVEFLITANQKMKAEAEKETA